MISRRTPAEIAKIDRACALVREVLVELSDAVREGVETRELDALAERRTHDAGARPAFKGYMGYPACLCISVNEEVVHGIPGKRALAAGGGR